MRSESFKKGVLLPHIKPAQNERLTECPAPSSVFIPLSQHIGKPAVAVVSAGDKVRAGTLIGRADGAFSANIFSSVSGSVKSVSVRKTPNGRCDHIEIENDGEYTEEFLPPMPDMSRESILKRITDAGLVGMGGAGFPAGIKFAPKQRIDTFIINAAECEPYITCDHRVLAERAAEFLRGASYLSAALGTDSFTVGIEDNKKDVIELLNAAACALNINAKVVSLKTKYPQGAEKQLIYALTRRKVPVGKLPADVGVVVGNVQTAYALYDAVENGRPLYRRAMTVCGGGMNGKGNLLVRTGTLYSDCVKHAGGLNGDCVKLVSGGPMMGFALDSLDYSVTKTTGAVLALSRREADIYTPTPCINCAKCARVCPMRLMPMYIEAYTLRGDYASAKKYGAANCIECGCCAYCCPAKRPIVQSVRLAKQKIRELKL